MTSRLFEKTVLKDIPFGSYRVVGAGNFNSSSKKGPRFVLMVGRNGYNPLVRVPEGVVLSENVEIKEEVVVGKKRLCCVISGTEKKAKDGFELIKVCHGPEGGLLPWMKTIKYFYANRKWTIFQIDDRKFNE